MSKLPVVNFKTMDRLLGGLGFIKARQKGSHAFYRHPDGRTTTVPNHPGRDLARPLIREILKEIELSTDDYIKSIKQ
ncbi:MAG: type II toxin-antitoxin system HicA family toxin [Nitrospinae bacterium]|nr:type II toxin-antitoxin system HicA family toxin [Nitrospinota bacterium]